MCDFEGLQKCTESKRALEAPKSLLTEWHSDT